MYKVKQKNTYGQRTEHMDRGGEDLRLDDIEATIIDLRKTLSGDTTAKRWKELKIELTREEGSLLELLLKRNQVCLPGNERYSTLVEVRPK